MAKQYIGELPISASSDTTKIPLDGWNDLPAVQYEEALVLRITASGDFTSSYAVGDRIKLTQDATEKQFIASQIDYADSYTYFVLNGNGTTLSANAITNPYYSHTFSPVEFPDSLRKNQLLADVKSVDGATSGLDADLLDGKHLSEILLLVYPVGAIYTSVVNTSPATLFGGTWEAFAAGRVLVGLDSTQTEFDTVEETGGEKTHALSLAEMPTHKHGVLAANDSYPAGSATTFQFRSDKTSSDYAEQMSNKGSGTAHNNLQPYIVVYMWKRTA